MVPSPEQFSQRPPLTLNENRPGPYPRTLASVVSANSVRMLLNTPVYVAGLDRGVRPIGDWSTPTTLSTWSTPLIRVCRPGTIRAPLIWLASTVYRMSLTRVDLPEPLTPVTAMNWPSGKPTVRLRRLCSRAPCTTSSRPGVCGRRVRGVGIALRPDRYAPVGDCLLASSPCTDPLCTICPPCSPAPGPMSTIQSA